MTDNPNLPISGVNLQAANFPAFQKAMEKANKLIEEQGKKAETAAKQSQKAADASGKFDKGIQSLIQRFTSGSPAIQKATGFLEQFGVQLTALPIGALAAVGAIAALTTVFVALGQRGAGLVGLAESFDRLTNSIGITSRVLLQDLRTASEGTVADFKLIQLANVALAGAVGQFGTEFGEKLPKLLEIARVQARATGQDVDFLFQSLITGIKRGSPLLIDNTGLVLKVEQANKDYAEAIDKTVTQLTAEDKQIALLNATLAAGEVAITTLGDAQETAANKIARGQATITNILDTLAVSVQPAFSAILDAGNAILGQLDQLAKALGPIITEITNAIGGTIAVVVNMLSALLQPIVDLISGLAPYVTLALRTINTVVGGVQQIILGVAKQVFGFVGDLKQLPKALFEGAAAAFGAFANAIIQVANQLIFPAVIGIAQFIADFLIGLSPPPKGPLSKIDQGGANMMIAWLEGITGVSLEPVAQVAAEVNALLGNIGSLSAKQVAARLAQLDAALLPFQNRLEIVKSTFDALSEPAKAALDAIDRQIAQSLEALGQGDQQAAALIRSLDAQRESIAGVLSDQQRLVDNAQIQLALAKAQQAQERTLLTIQQARVKVETKVAQKRKESAGGAKTPEAKKLTGAAPLPEVPGAGGGIGALPDSGVLDDISGQGAVDEALLGLQNAFAGQINAGGALGQFNANREQLGGILQTIGGVDLGGKITARFDGIREGIETALEDARATVEAKVAEIGVFFTDADTEGTLPYFFRRLGVELINVGVVIRDEISQVIRNIFDPEMETSITFLALDFIDSLINPEREGSIPYFFSQLPNHIATAIGDIGAVIQQVVIAPIAAFLTGTGPGTISGILDSVVVFFASLPGRIVDVLRGLGLLAFNAIVKPIEQVVNSLIGLLEQAVRTLLQSIIDIISPQVGTILDVGGMLSQAVETLKSMQSNIHFDRLNIAAPEFLNASAGTTNNTTVNNTFNIQSPGAAEFAMRRAAFGGAAIG